MARPPHLHQPREAPAPKVPGFGLSDPRQPKTIDDADDGKDHSQKLDKGKLEQRERARACMNRRFTGSAPGGCFQLETPALSAQYGTNTICWTRFSPDTRTVKQA